MDLYIPRRLAKFLADARVGSKVQIEALAANGAIRLNGNETANLARLVDPQMDCVEVHERRVGLCPPQIYAMLHKPARVVTTLSDPKGKRCVADLLPDKWQGRVGVVGRLDKATTGALLVTDDGDLSYLLTHPEFHVWKRYVLTVRGTPTDDDPRLMHMREGVMVQSARTQPARCGVVADSARLGKNDQPESDVWMEIREGRNRQVRRMANLVGLRLVHLHRAAIGPLQLGDLERSHWRMLTPAEVDVLYESAGGRAAPTEGARRALKRRLDDGQLDASEASLVVRYLARK
ncbi:MAG: rRNA pseudouridine synthase [Myxococcales bacterium]|nr:rRNA pseudouridine synthase [Myxococcales bacterium]